ncbi:MAG: FKBP-type peptidyl-prolyl cis-trans isomerase [Bacteroidales bacterium]
MKKYEKKTFYFLLITLMIILIGSCNKDSEDPELAESSNIAAFLAQYPTLNFEQKPSGLYYLDVEVGTGLLPATHDTAFIFYSVRLLDGRILDTNFDTSDTLIMPVNEGLTISGFEEGLSYMHEGGEVLLLVPSKLAYGATGDIYGVVPPYTPILLNIALVKVKPGSSGKK